jgi:hypothetical protein
MLHKFSRAISSHPQAFVPKRAINNASSSLDELQQTIRKAGASPNPMPILREVRASALFAEVVDMIEAAHNAVGNSENAHLDPQARLAAAGDAICYALHSVTKMSRYYDMNLVTRRTGNKADGAGDAEANNRVFMEQIKDDHVVEVKSSFGESWDANSTVRQAAILSALKPEVAADLGLTATPEHKDLAKIWGPISPLIQLNESELLALVDYVHSQTEIFNAVNGSALLQAYYGDKLLSGVTQVFSTALNSAITKLSEHQYFGLRDVVAYKGVKLTSYSGPFRKAALEAAVGNSKPIVFPQVLSATRDPMRSYAVAKHDQGYSLECEIMMASGVDADPFHDADTMGEMEVIGPAGQKFVVTDKQQTGFSDPNRGGISVIDRYVLKPAHYDPAV